MSGRSGPQSAAGLCVGGAAVLVISLFLTWSHQLTPPELARFGGPVSYGVAADPSAWQVYAIAAEVLAVLSVAVAAAGLWGGRTARWVALLAVALGLAFVIHAGVRAPTNGLLLSGGAGNAARYLRDPATAGPGETLALVGLILGAVGLTLGLVPIRSGAGRDAA